MQTEISDNRSEQSSRPVVMWVAVVIAFATLIAAWTTLIVIAAKNQPARIEVGKTAE